MIRERLLAGLNLGSILWPTVSGVLAVACVILAIIVMDLKDELFANDNEVARIRMEDKEQQKKLEKWFKRPKQSQIYYTALTEAEIEQLKRKGLADPIQDLAVDLVKHPELIPMEPVLGGTMDFWRDAVMVLGPGRVRAEFEDGHIGGHMILEYQVSDSGKISWTVLEAQD